MDDCMRIITENRLFENVSEDIIRDFVLPHGSRKTYPKDSSIFMPLDRVDCIRVLLSGKVKLVYYLENGDQDLGNMILPPKLIGVDLVCTRTRISPYQAVAAENSEVFAFPARIILDPGTLPEKERLKCIRNLLLVISNVNMQNEYRLAILTRSGLRERIMVYLTMQAGRTGKQSFTIPFSRDEMASFLRVNRSALSHELSLLRQEGIIDFSKNSFTMLYNRDEESRRT